MLELKCVEEKIEPPTANLSQSYHVGIEMLLMPQGKISCLTLNRTMLELKFYGDIKFSNPADSLNRTMLELKSKHTVILYLLLILSIVPCWN